MFAMKFRKILVQLFLSADMDFIVSPPRRNHGCSALCIIHIAKSEVNSSESQKSRYQNFVGMFCI